MMCASENTTILNIILKVLVTIFTYLCLMVLKKMSMIFALTVERR